MPNIPFTGKKHLYRTFVNGQPYRKYLTVIQLAKISKIAGAMNKDGERGIKRRTISERLNLGWDAWDAVHLPNGIKIGKKGLDRK